MAKDVDNNVIDMKDHFQWLLSSIIRNEQLRYPWIIALFVRRYTL